MKEETQEPGFGQAEIFKAYLDCRRRKRGTISALRFEMNLAENLLGLEEELNSGGYRPARSVCFVNFKPKPREIFAAEFRDRVVHHLFVRDIEKYWERVFINDSYACRPGKGTHAAVDRLDRFVKRLTRGGRRRAWFLQIDIHNFFMSIDRRILFRMINRGLRRQYGVPDWKLPLFCAGYERYRAMRELAAVLIFHEPTRNYTRKSPACAWNNIRDHKTLFNCPAHKGLPIGNLTSQFFGNVYLNILDQFVKHELKARRYIRYVDDAVLLHADKGVLAGRALLIEKFVGEKLLLRLNDKVTRIKPVSCGINFLGYIVHPDHRLTRRRVAGNFEARLESFREKLVRRDPEYEKSVYRFNRDDLEKLLCTLNSYLAHLARASSFSLLSAILEKHTWLRQYFKVTALKAERTWSPPKDFPGIADQYGWFRSRWPEEIIFFQVGKYFELYGRDSVWANLVFGLRQIKPRFYNMSRVGVPKRMIAGRIKEARNLGLGVLTVTESGYPLYRLKERLPDVLRVA